MDSDTGFIIFVFVLALGLVCCSLGLVAIVEARSRRLAVHAPEHETMSWRRRVDGALFDPRLWPKFIVELLDDAEVSWRLDHADIVIYRVENACESINGTWYCVRTITFDKVRGEKRCHEHEKQSRPVRGAFAG